MSRRPECNCTCRFCKEEQDCGKCEWWDVKRCHWTILLEVHDAREKAETELARLTDRVKETLTVINGTRVQTRIDPNHNWISASAFLDQIYSYLSKGLKKQSYWLAEHPNSKTPLYRVETPVDGFIVTTDVHSALRFPTCEACESWIRANPSPKFVAREHMDVEPK